jgi:hypothetical protein
MDPGLGLSPAGAGSSKVDFWKEGQCSSSMRVISLEVGRASSGGIRRVMHCDIVYIACFGRKTRGENAQRMEGRENESEDHGKVSGKIKIR